MLSAELHDRRAMRKFMLDEEVIDCLKLWPKPVRNNGKVMYCRSAVGDAEIKSEELALLELVSGQEQEAKKHKVDEEEEEKEEEHEQFEDDGEEDEELHRYWNILEFGEFVQAFWASSSPCILERKCYCDIWGAIEEDFQKGKTRAIVIGNPGIGKSGFLLYVLWQLVQRDCRILLQNKAGERTLLERKGLYYCETYGDFRDDLSSDKELYYLVDGQLPHPPHFAGKLILTCSENYKEVMKDGRRTVFYMPVWKPDELAAADQEVFKRGFRFWSERYNKWGGVPRYVLEQCDEDADKNLNDAIHCSGNIGRRCTGDHECSSKIMHMMVRNDFRSFEYVFASKYVRERVFRKLYQTDKSGLRSFLLLSGNQTFLELLCREILPRGGLFQTKRVHARRPWEHPVDPERLERVIVVGDYAQWQNAPWDSMFWPPKNTQQSWDAFRLRKNGDHVLLYFYQVSMSPGRHQQGVKAKGVLDLKAEIESVLHVEILLEHITVYIVTLVELLGEGGYQNWRGVKNHVLKDERLVRKLESIGQKVLGIPF